MQLLRDVLIGLSQLRLPSWEQVHVQEHSEEAEAHWRAVPDLGDQPEKAGWEDARRFAAATGRPDVLFEVHKFGNEPVNIYEHAPIPGAGQTPQETRGAKPDAYGAKNATKEDWLDANGRSCVALRAEGFWDEHPAVLTEPRFLDANGHWEDREAKLFEEVFCNEPEPKATAIFRGAVVKKLAEGTKQAPHTWSFALLPAWQEQGLLLDLLKPGQEGGDKNEGKTLEGAAEADHPSEESNPADEQLAAEERVQPGAYR